LFVYFQRIPGIIPGWQARDGAAGFFDATNLYRDSFRGGRSMAVYSFESVLVRPDGVGTWTYLNIPPDVSAALGSKGQVRVKGTVNACPYRSTVLPMGDGSHYLVVGKEIRDHIHAQQGDTVLVTLELDLEERRVVLPEDFEAAFANHPQARAEFDKLSYSHQKEYGDWIQGARKAETRLRRIETMLESLPAGKNLRQIS
jgi:Domain of unknown function (DUF1905)/Bacteriocin-protection, YdeI or OmpD-Associated